MKYLLTLFVVSALWCVTATADTRPDLHAPISVMGEHLHKKGELMFSYRFMIMMMRGNRDGSSRLSTDQIATTVTNRFANPPMMPPTLRVVPSKMTMDMHMLGLMYAPSDRVTLMAMTSYLDKKMDHITFMGAMGTNRLGTFTTESEGFGDSNLSALIKLADNGRQRWHATVGVSLPTGSVDKTDRLLTPMNTQPLARLPYPMQLGSGGYDLITGITYAGNDRQWGWGGQWRSTFRLTDNKEHYRLGNEHQLQSWFSFLVNPAVSISGRVAYNQWGNINGIDPQIMAPVQTADPARQGKQRIDVGLGANFLLPGQRHRIALEIVMPVAQNLDGPQLETDWQVMVGWQFAPR